LFLLFVFFTHDGIVVADNNNVIHSDILPMHRRGYYTTTTKVLGWRRKNGDR
jgi:hypothetical protein